MNQLLFSLPIARGCSAKPFFPVLTPPPLMHAAALVPAQAAIPPCLPHLSSAPVSLPSPGTSLFCSGPSSEIPSQSPLCFPDWCVAGCANSVYLECFHQLYCGCTVCVSFCNKELAVADFFIGRHLRRRFYSTVRTDSQQLSIWKS